MPWLKVVSGAIRYHRCPAFMYFAQGFGELRTPSGMSKNMATLRKQHSKLGSKREGRHMIMDEHILSEEHPIILTSSYLHNNRIESDGFLSAMESGDTRLYALEINFEKTT